VAHADLVRAQDERPPYPAIFGGAVESSARESLNLSTSLFGGYDSNQIAGTTGSGFSPIAFQSTGPYTGLTPDLTFGTNGTSFDVQASAGTDLRYYNEFGRVITLSNHGGVDFFIRKRSTNVRIGQTISYLPSNLGALFARPPTSAVPGPPDVLPAPDYYAAYADRYVNYVTSGNVDYHTSRQGTLSVNLDAGYTHYVDSQAVLGLGDLPSYHAGTQYSQRIDRKVSLQFGYIFGRASYSHGFRPVSQHDITAGMTYQRPLSATRRMTFQFNLGSTIYGEAQPTPASDTPTSPGGEPPLAEQGHHVAATGSASVSRPIGRSWNLMGSYYHGLSFVSGLRDAVFNDSLSVSASGFLNRRIDLTASGSYAFGSFPLAASTSSDYSTYTANIRARFGLTNGLAAYADYTYYYYLFDNRVLLAPGLPPELTRNSIQGGITLWLPIVTHH
jgi:hypothetical protein